MLLSKATEYAIRALVYIAARSGAHRKPGFKEIAKEIDAPEPYTAKILQILSRKGLARSVKGPGGGFFIDASKPPMLLKEVILAMEGDEVLTKCGLGLKNCSSENPCPIHQQYSAIRQEINRLASTETIQNLAQKLANGEAVVTRPRL